MLDLTMSFAKNEGFTCDANPGIFTLSKPLKQLLPWGIFAYFFLVCSENQKDKKDESLASNSTSMVPVQTLDNHHFEIKVIME